MSKYILKSEYGLRSYIGMPRLLITRFSDKVIPMISEDWEFLLKCDGVTDITVDDKTAKIIKKSTISSVIRENNENSVLSEWQTYKSYDNKFFPSIEWRITDRCNFNCLHCYNAADLSASAEIWEINDAYTFLDQARDSGVLEIRLSGGEPMMHTDFMKIVKAVYDREMFIGQIITNGYYLTQKILDEIASYGHKPLFKVSFDGFGFHDWIRDYDGAEQKALQSFELLSKNGFPILVNAQVNRRNKESIWKTIDYFDNLGINTLRFIRTSEAPRWTMNAGDACMPYNEYYDFMLEVIKYYITRERAMQLILWQFAILNPTRKKFAVASSRCKESQYRDSLPICMTCRTQVCVGASGNLYPCSQMSGHLDQIGTFLGNVKDGNLSDLFKEGPYVDYATMTVGDIRKNNEECAACSHFKKCHGGCRAMASILTEGNRYGEFPGMCILVDGDYESKIEALLPDWKNEYADNGDCC